MTTPSLAEGLLRAAPLLKLIFDDTRRRRIRILILADGKMGFDDSDLGLGELIDKGLRPSATPWEELIIVTAHRSADDRTAVIPGFRFDTIPTKAPFNVPFTREHYEQVWLFGRAEEHLNEAPHPHRLEEPELAVLAKFMQEGGGVFATGDHEDLGAAMCGRVPRVRSMRRWFCRGVPEPQRAPGRNDTTRLDTLREGLDAGFTTDDQSDRVPQEIRPRFRTAEGRTGVAEPHPLLARGKFAVTVLPDHMHVGECVVPSGAELEAEFSFGGEPPAFEFPKLPGVEQRLAPEVVAVAASAGGYIKDEPDLPPIEPRCFNVIVAYDGSRVGVGRVAVDASFHHFVHVNLRGNELSHSNDKKGLYDAAGNPTEDYKAIKQYYRNLVTWLCPPEVRVEYYVNLLAGLRHLSPLDEEIRPTPRPTLEDVLYAGTVTREMITNMFSRAEATQCALALSALLPEEPRAAAAKLIDPCLPSALRDSEPVTPFFTGEPLVKVILGGAMLGVAEILPPDPSLLRESLALNGEGGLGAAAAAGLEKGFGLTARALDDFNRRHAQFSSTLSKFR